MDDAPARTSKMADLKVRTLSAIVMIAVAGVALWAGGWVFTAFVALIALGLLWEWWGLISKFNSGALGRVLWMIGGVMYIGGACLILNYLWTMHAPNPSFRYLAIYLITIVISVDVGAYLFGRFIGGKKILPKISPSKTWSGLYGGVIFAIIFSLIFLIMIRSFEVAFIWTSLVCGVFVAIVSQAGDFFESWLKRKAGVKDSGALFPGHGGLFDRLDGLVAVIATCPISLMFAIGLIQ